MTIEELRDYVEEQRSLNVIPYQVSKTISRPRECVNAGCVAACCITVYEGNKEFFKDNPKNCPDFKKKKKMSKLPEERHAMGYKGETYK